MNLRKLHTYIGCFYAPLLLYFTLSGSWQVFQLHKHPKDVPATTSQTILHALSNPHVDGASPWVDAKDSHSTVFRVFTETMAVGFVSTILLGVTMALQMRSQRKAIIFSLILGAAVPAAVLLIGS